MPELESYDNGAFVVFKTRWKTYAARDKEGTFAPVWTRTPVSFGHVNI